VQEYVNPSRVAGLSALSASYPLNSNSPNYPLHDGSLESIIALQPDLIIVGQYNAWLLRDRLTKLGFNVVIQSLPTSVGEVESLIVEFHQLTELAAPTLVIPAPIAVDSKQRILKLGANGIATGTMTFESNLLAYAGWQNYINKQGYVHADLEQLVQDPPERLLLAAPSAPALANSMMEHSVWTRILAATQIRTSDDWRWQCPGPWTFELIKELQQWH